MNRAASIRRERELRERGDWHHEQGNLNMAVRDIESHVTDYGRHHRLVVSGEGGLRLVIREDVDTHPGLALSTDRDRRRVARIDSPYSLRGCRLVHVSSTPYQGSQGSRIEHVYHINRPRIHWMS